MIGPVGPVFDVKGQKSPIICSRENKAKALASSLFITKMPTKVGPCKQIISCIIWRFYSKGHCANTRCRQFQIIPRTTSWQTEKQVKSPLNTIQRDTAYTSKLCICAPTRSKGDTTVCCQHAWLTCLYKINKKTTLLCLHEENRRVNCLPTSLLDHFVTQQVLVICLVLG